MSIIAFYFPVFVAYFNYFILIRLCNACTVHITTTTTAAAAAAATVTTLWCEMSKQNIIVNTMQRKSTVVGWCVLDN